MKRGKTLFSSLGLTGCICWAIAAMCVSIARAESNDTSNSASLLASGIDINDSQYLQSIGLMRAEADRGVPVVSEAFSPDIKPIMVDPGTRLIPLPPDTPQPESLSEGDPRGTCSVIYSNLLGAQFAAVIAGNNIITGDDTTMATSTTNRFVCTIQVFIGSFGGIQPYTLRCQIWAPHTAFSVCPDNGSNLLAEDLHVQVSPAFHQEVFNFNEVLVPNSFLTALVTPFPSDQGGGVGPAWVITRDFSGAGEIGTSADLFYEGEDLNNDCSDDYRFFGGGVEQANFGIEITAGPGPTGSCCNQTNGICTDGVLLSACNQFGQRFSLDPCPQTPACAICSLTCAGATVLENEPVCGSNYVDTRNNGCAFGPPATESFINVSCGADICGQYGTYTFLNGTITENRRDNDYYRLTLASTQRVTWSVTGEGPSNATIFIPIGAGNGCGNLVQPAGAGDVASGSSTSGCTAAVAAACLPPGTYYLVARANAFEGIPCGTDYRATVTCAPCTLPTGACCLPNGSCVVQSAIDCQQDQGVYRGDGSACPPTGPACPQPPTNETCLTKNTVPAITTNTTVNFDTSFAVTESTANVLCGAVNQPMFKDIWYDYVVPAAAPFSGGTPPTFGRIAVSTYESCFDTKVAVYRVDPCGGDQATQCNNSFLLLCNDDINDARGNLASYLEVLDNGGGIQPAPGECYKIRVGGGTSTSGGAGTLRVDYIPSLPTPWSTASGRCCFPNGTCEIRPSDNPGSCASAGGYLTSVTNFGEGDPTFTEYTSVGCNTLPCPAPGEACFNALNLNTAPGIVSGFGTTTRAITNKLFYRYQIPVGAAVGSGITISTCGSSFNTAIAVYSDFDQSTGSCMGQTPIASNDNCSPAETSAAGAQGIASCFNIGEPDSCLCLTVGSIGQPTGPGSTIYIEIGAANTILGSTQLSIDPVPQNCGTPVTASLTLTASPACFVCNITCPGGSFIENEPVCGSNYVDNTNVGCNAEAPATPVFQDITCGATICGESGTYVFFNGTTSQNRRDLDWYRFSLTTAKQINVSLTAAFPAAIFIVRDVEPTTACEALATLASTTSQAGCITTELSADACAGTYYVVIGTANFTGVTCGSDYTATITCDPADLPNCCKGDMNNDGRVNGADIRGFVDVVLNPLSGPFPITGCYNLNTCRADFTGDTFTTTADIPGFVTALLATGNCPTLANCSDPARCHLPDQSGGTTSDLSAAAGCNVRAADDFRVDVAGTVSSVCWYGFYVNLAAGTACSPQSGSSPDNFSITFYNDNAGVPGTVKAGPFGGLTVTKTATGETLSLAGIGTVNEYKYETTLAANPNLALSANTCYWIEIVNASTGACCWVWEAGGFANDVSASRNGGPAGLPNYVAANLGTGDMAFCLNDLRINKRDCGLPQGRCCITQGQTVTCQTTDVFQCVNVLEGAWTEGLNCTSNPCPTGDECINAQAISCGQSFTVNMPADGHTANPNDPVSTCEINNGGPFTKDSSWWYSFTPNFTGNVKISMCTTNPSLDVVMTIFNANQACGSLTQKACDDDFCAFPNFSPSCLVTSVVSGANYKILVDHYSPAQAGAYTISISCPGTACP